MDREEKEIGFEIECVPVEKQTIRKIKDNALINYCGKTMTYKEFKDKMYGDPIHLKDVRMGDENE